MSKLTLEERDSSTRLQIVAGLLAIVFGSLIIGIISIANRGELNSYFGFLKSVPYGDKIGHFFLMGILSFLVNMSFLTKRISIGGWKFLLGSVIVAALVTAEEVSQAFLPNRTLSFSDWVADMAGIILFGQIAIWVVKLR